MSLLVPIIVAFIIALQIFFFVKNVLRMRDYKKIFAEENSWGIAHNPETNFVSGIYGRGNNVFESIKESINKYLENNSGSVIDFSLLKDAVDRHCDSVENDINTLTPTPLYCGLAGTMAGVIVGLGSLITTGSITDLLSSGSGNFGTAAEGVNDLLSGVAWAMLASIMGIMLTTIASLLFKRYKLQGESGKNTFLAWLQAKLLPELPSDTSDALNRLVKNLNKFNNTFAENTSSLRGALREVNESYRIQGDVIKAVHDMDVMKMAKANVRVLEELKECTDKLEQFNKYLDDIHGYTDAIHTFTTSELNSTLVQQAEEFKRIIADERESFERLNTELRVQFGAELNQIPMLQKQLVEIAGIPGKLDKLIDRMERSNSSLASQVSSTMTQTVKELTSVSFRGEFSPYSVQPILPRWMKWIVVVSVILIALACITNTVYNIWFASDSASIEATVEDIDEKTDSTSVIQQMKDSVQMNPVQQPAQAASVQQVPSQNANN